MSGDPGRTDADGGRGFRELIERNADGVVVLRPDGSIAYANAAAGDLLGRDPAGLVGEPFGIPVVSGERTELDVPRGGEVRHAEMRVVDAGWDGAPALLASLRDVTERRRQEQALRESEERFRLLVEGVKDYGILMLDPRGRIVSWNSGAERLTGYPESEAIGRHVRMLCTPEDRASGIPEGEQRRAVREGRAEEERWHVRRDGTRFWGSDVLTPLHDEAGGLRGFAKVLRDITERRRMEEELRRRADGLAEADRQKTEFLAMLAHELRNPLAPVLNAVHIMRICGVDAETIERARDMVEHQVRHMARLVDDLLDVSRITRGKIELRREPLDLAEVIARALESARPVVQARGHALQVRLDDGPLDVFADPTRIEQVLMNLLANAAKYTDPGGRIELSAGREGAELVVRVRDNGIGMPAELIPEVFDLFSQADRSLDRTQGGLGIGLTLVRSLVELHGGRVEARSDGPGAGSEFIVRLPAAASPRPARNGLAPEPTAVAAGPLRVVVVDDNVHAARSLALLLRRWGHEPALAHDGLEALDVAREHGPDVVLLDIGLPRLDGYQVARRLRERPPAAGPRLAIIAMTGYGQDEDRRRALEAGCDLHLVKPVDPETLRDILADPAGVARAGR